MSCKKPEGIENRKAYIVRGMIEGLVSAVFLIDDAQMPGERELEPTMECLWYLCSKIPSHDDPRRTILDESYDSNLESTIHSECRLLLNITIRF